jgi:DUF1680 family protein
MNKYLSVGLFGLSLLCNGVSAAPLVADQTDNHFVESPLAIKNVWSPLAVTEASGLLGERLALFRTQRIPFLLNTGYLIDGFESRPGEHTYQGEHFGKWLHAATLAYVRTRDPELKKSLDSMVERLLASQLENGYLGTYEYKYAFTSYPENIYTGDVTDETVDHEAEKLKKIENPNGRGWDIWSHRYNLYGLLVYEKYFQNPEVVTACRKMADLLIEVYGAGTVYDITKSSTRWGMSASTLLESMMMLYERTGDQKYLDFSLHIVDQCEANPKHRLLSTMLEKGEFYDSGDGKAYQIMANLLGYLLIYRATDDRKYLDAVLHGWNKIKEQHLIVTGGPWSGKREGDETWGVECFSRMSDFTPEKSFVEGCSDATWIQLNIHLYELTGETKYMDEAELCLFNDSLAHQGRDGVMWCYFTRPNQAKPPYFDKPEYCCASSIPRAMNMYANRMLGTTEGRLVINSLSPFTGSLGDSFGEGHVTVQSQFPYRQTATIEFSDNQKKQFDCEIRLPMNTLCKKLTLNGKEIAATLNDQGNPVIANRWKSGDVLTVELEFLLKAEVTTGKKGKSWVAFTYGPVVLAQKLEKDALQEEPFLGKSTVLSTLKGMLTQSVDDAIDFAVNDSNVALIPFVDAMADDMTIVTYFKLD